MKVQADSRQGFWPEAEARQNFERDLSAGLGREWNSLAQESDPEIMAATALRLAARLEDSGQNEKSVFLLSGLAEAPELEPDLRAKAAARRAVLQGGGEIGDRFEFLLSRFTHEASRPWPLLAMGAAGSVFHFSRLALLARLRGPVSVLVQPLATIGEAATFSLALPALEKISSRPGAVSSREFGQEFLSSLLLMSALKLSTWPLRFTGPALRFPLLYGGVLFAQGAERKLGLQAPAGLGTALVDGLALSLQLHAGAGLAQLALGKRGLRLMAEAEIRTRGLNSVILSASEGPPTAMGGMRSLVPLWVFAALRMTREQKLLPNIHAMSEHSSDRPRPPLRLVSRDPHQEFVQTFGTNRRFQEAYHRILNHYGDRHDSGKLHGLILSSGVQHPATVIPGLGRLADTLQLSKFGEASVSYRDWLVQKIYDRVYFENRSPQALGELLRSLALNENAAALELRLATHFPELNLRTPKSASSMPHTFQAQIDSTKQLYEWRQFERSTSILPLDNRARQVVFDWKGAQAANPLGNMTAKIDRFLDDFYDLGQGPHAVRVLEVNAALGAAGDSLMGVARLSRLESLMRASQGQPSLERLKELNF